MSGTLAAKLQDDAPLRRSDAKEVDPAYGEGHHVKREVTASPAVWCETRQELCEGTPYFRSYQSGLYHLDGIAKGYLIDGFAAERDVWAGKVFVSHGGGKQRSGGQEEQHNAMQQMSTIGAHSSAAPLRGSQEETDLSIRILRNTWAKALPLIVIMGSHYPLADFVMPARYAVLGWWMITHIWTEKEFVNVEADVADGERPYNVRVKCRFQWLDQNLHEPWFLKPNANRSCLARPKLHTCKKCKAVSPIVYHVPMCLVRTCDFFWKVFSERDGRWADPQKLSYNGDFLRPFQLPGRFSPKLDVKPIFPIEISEQYAPRAVHCELCGRISQRVELTSWTCAVCNYAPKSYFKEQYPVSLLRRSLPGSVNFKNEVPGCLYLLPNSGIEVARDRVEDGTYAHGLDRVTYHLPTGGRIVHILATEEHPLSINGWKLWGDYQRKVSMKRCKFVTHRVKGFLTQNFLHNAGEVYNFSIAMPSCPFETAPEEVEFARDILQQVSPESPINELLSIFYLEGQKMAYHDDGEKEVCGPIIGWSIGSDSAMKFRKKMPKRRPEQMQGLMKPNLASTSAFVQTAGKEAEHLPIAAAAAESDSPMCEQRPLGPIHFLEEDVRRHKADAILVKLLTKMEHCGDQLGQVGQKRPRSGALEVDWLPTVSSISDMDSMVVFEGGTTCGTYHAVSTPEPGSHGSPSASSFKRHNGAPPHSRSRHPNEPFGRATGPPDPMRIASIVNGRPSSPRTPSCMPDDEPFPFAFVPSFSLRDGQDTDVSGEASMRSEDGIGGEKGSALNTTASALDPGRDIKVRPHNPMVLKLLTRHGDLVIMHNTAVQTHYEHSVQPHGLRLCVTGRTLVSAGGSAPAAEPFEAAETYGLKVNPAPVV